MSGMQPSYLSQEVGMGSRDGVEKRSAQKAGVTLEEWRGRRTKGEKWCYCCRQWRPVLQFGKDVSRTDGLKSACFPCASIKSVASRFGIKVGVIRDMRSRSGGACEICGR